ncbi:CBS domain-containing protein [Pedobacter sp.]|uniref:CBS domain-containing protein n=1 Tax=Pedobacter sp. TaxID=1411316 RepID=UPI003D7F9FCE
MKTVQQLLATKSTLVYSVTPNTLVLEALQFMMEKNISSLLVQENNALLGIFTERDYARKIVLQGKSSASTLIEEVMTSELTTVKLRDSIENCMKIMTDRRIRHLPVVENNEVKGLVSIGDVVKFIIEDQKQTINALENYINS